jgi:hypothetical protein
MNAATIRTRVAPWSGFIAAPLGWALHQQVLADMLHFNCHLGGAAAGLLGFAIAGALIVTGGWLSWRARGEERAAPRWFVATLGTMAAALFGFAIVLQTIATLILPGCGAS